MEIIQIDKVCIAVVPFAPIDFLMERVLLRKLLNKQIISIGETFKGASKKNSTNVEKSRSTPYKL